MRQEQSHFLPSFPEIQPHQEPKSPEAFPLPLIQGGPALSISLFLCFLRQVGKQIPEFRTCNLDIEESKIAHRSRHVRDGKTLFETNL